MTVRDKADYLHFACIVQHLRRRAGADKRAAAAMVTMATLAVYLQVDNRA